MKERTRINKQIRTREVRVIDDKDGNLGVISTEEALRIAEEKGLDLIEISPNTDPPVAKIMDYGKFQYDQKKKEKRVKAKSHITETKVLQVKIGTSEHDLSMKANRASKWLTQGNRIKLDLFLPGRAKYLDIEFLKGRLDRLLKLITVGYKVAEEPKKSPKGLTIVLEKDK